MIRIVKPGAPDVLGTRGVEETEALCEAFVKDPEAYRSGDRRLPFLKAVYGDASVVAELRRAQHGKCCYCEVRIETPYMDEHVEHWRPKGSVKQRNREEEFRPGYYWLAYVWDNLLLACQVCNRNNKGSQFPVADPGDRARSHLDAEALDRERPLLLKPDALDPEDHIVWREDVPIGLSPEGRMSIEVLGLVRDLDTRRSQTLTTLRRALDNLRRYRGDPSPTIQGWLDEEREVLRGAILPQSPHSAMAKAFLAANEPWSHL